MREIKYIYCNEKAINWTAAYITELAEAQVKFNAKIHGHNKNVNSLLMNFSWVKQNKITRALLQGNILERRVKIFSKTNLNRQRITCIFLHLDIKLHHNVSFILLMGGSSPKITVRFLHRINTMNNYYNATVYKGTSKINGTKIGHIMITNY